MPAIAKSFQNRNDESSDSIDRMVRRALRARLIEQDAAP
jgi:hypothetical protein